MFAPSQVLTLPGRIQEGTWNRQFILVTPELRETKSFSQERRAWGRTNRPDGYRSG
jgi:hypothetical protein